MIKKHRKTDISRLMLQGNPGNQLCDPKQNGIGNAHRGNEIPRIPRTVSDDALSVSSGQSFQVLPRKKQTAFSAVIRQAKM